MEQFTIAICIAVENRFQQPHRPMGVRSVQDWSTRRRWASWRRRRPGRSIQNTTLMAMVMAVNEVRLSLEEHIIAAVWVFPGNISRTNQRLACLLALILEM